MIEPEQPGLPIARQCKLLALSRSTFSTYRLHICADFILLCEALNRGKINSILLHRQTNPHRLRHGQYRRQRRIALLAQRPVQALAG